MSDYQHQKTISFRAPSYLVRRKYSFYFRIRIPKNLRHKFCFKSEVRVSLRTAQITTAKYRARVLAGFFQGIFIDLKRGGYIFVLTNEQINDLIQNHIKQLLDEDLIFRLEYPDHQPKEEWHRQELHGDMMEERGKTEEALVSYDYTEASKAVSTILAEADIKENSITDLEFNQMCQQFLKAKIGYWEVMAERFLGKHLTSDLNSIDSNQIQKNDDKGPFSEQMTAPAPTHQHSQSEKTVTVGNLADTYWKERVEHLKPGSKKNYVTYDKRIREFFGNETPVITLDYYKCLEFRDWIKNYRKDPLSPKKVNDYLDYLKGMLNWEMKTTKNLRGIGNPAEGVRDNEPSRTQANVPFTMEELELMFVKSKEYSLDKCRTEHNFWVPLIGLFTGAREEEICQARASDIYKGQEELWIFDINEIDEKKSVKTGERRQVPLHPFLIQLGLPRYAQSLPEKSHLWPGLNFTANRWSHGFVNYFKKFKDRNGIDPTPRLKTFHSFRKTIGNYLKDKGVPEVRAAELLGHSHPNITYALYGKEVDLQKLSNAAVMKLDFHERLDLNHLSKSKWAVP